MTIFSRRLSRTGAGLLFVLLSFTPGVSYSQSKVTSPVASPSATRMAWYYDQAVKNSMYTSPSKICYDLIPVTDSNDQIIWDPSKKYLLVASWKSNASWYPQNSDSNKTYNTGDRENWVSIAPQLKNRMKAVARKDINMRLRQLLGLPPTADYKYFVTFWVNKNDLFRPCPDNEITDSHCEICIKPNTDPAYVQWIYQSRNDRYFNCDTTQRYPWTALGYTYDWSPENRSHIGVSEFVVKKNATVYINHIYTTEEYIYGK